MTDPYRKESNPPELKREMEWENLGECMFGVDVYEPKYDYQHMGWVNGSYDYKKFTKEPKPIGVLICVSKYPTRLFEPSNLQFIAGTRIDILAPLRQK